MVGAWAAVTSGASPRAPSDRPDVSVVVPTRQGGDRLEGLWAAVRPVVGRWDGAVEVIFVQTEEIPGERAESRARSQGSGRHDQRFALMFRFSFGCRWCGRVNGDKVSEAGLHREHPSPYRGLQFSRSPRWHRI